MSKQVLYVEHRDPIRTRVAQDLRTRNTVFQTGDPYQALRNLRGNPGISIVVINISLPGALTGINLMHELISINAKLEFIVLKPGQHTIGQGLLKGIQIKCMLSLGQDSDMSPSDIEALCIAVDEPDVFNCDHPAVDRSEDRIAPVGAF